MASTYRAVGPFNGVLPAPTGHVIGFARDPMKHAFLNYVQEIPAPIEGNGLFRWCELAPDEPVTLVSSDEQQWAIGDPMPKGHKFIVRAKWTEGQTQRFAFNYTLPLRTEDGWSRGAGISLHQLYDRINLNQAMLNRAYRVVTAIRGYSWASAQTTDLNTLRGTTGSFWDTSSGTELLPSGFGNPDFQVIKKTLNIIQRKLDLQTNGATNGNEYLCVMGPTVAQAIAESGEIVNYLKQQAGARQDLMVRNKKWGVPDSYNGFTMIVEDTPRVTIRANADSTQASVTASERGYLWSDDSVFFGSRVGALDGGYGFQNFSTVQLFTYNGAASSGGQMGESARAGIYVKGRTDDWNEMLEGAIVTEDVPKVVAPASGFYLTDVLQ